MQFSEFEYHFACQMLAINLESDCALCVPM